jgi:3-hydroxyisobutyrate dehydrogenase-like beta-hydroxyacid dehydrogenase
MTTAGFIGLGSQGAGMARRIIDRRVPTTLWARRAAALEPFAGQAAFAEDPAALGRVSDVVGICVTDGAAVREVTLGPDGVIAGMAQGTVLALHSTIGTDE